MSKSRWAAIAAAVVTFASPASAALVKVTYTGFATGGADEALFGGSGRFTDEAFSAAYLFNENPDETDLGVFLGATFTLNGHNFNITADSFASDRVFENFSRVTTLIYTNVTPVPPLGSYHTYILLSNNLTSFATPAARNVAYAADGYNNSSLNPIWNAFFIDSNDPAVGGGAAFILDNRHVAVTKMDAPPSTPTGNGVPFIGGVPEPAGWGLLVGGFSVTGAMLRRKRSSRALA